MASAAVEQYAEPGLDAGGGYTTDHVPLINLPPTGADVLPLLVVALIVLAVGLVLHRELNRPWDRRG